MISMSLGALAANMGLAGTAWARFRRAHVPVSANMIEQATAARSQMDQMMATQATL